MTFQLNLGLPDLFLSNRLPAHAFRFPARFFGFDWSSGSSYAEVARLGEVGEKNKRRWLWPVGLIATGLAGAAVALLRGCWHKKMSWPIRVQKHSYQVCLGCGIKRLFDEQGFRSYGPYSYDINHLIAWERARRLRHTREAQQKMQRPAS